MSDLVERLLKRAKDDQSCADNSKIIVDALSEQMRLFESREGHNVYAVRMAVDHKSGMERDTRYAADLLEAASRISQQDAELERMRRELAEVREKLKDPAAVRINYLRGDIACQGLIDEARAAAFREAAEIADQEGFVWITKALRAKAEETRI